MTQDASQGGQDGASDSLAGQGGTNPHLLHLKTLEACLDAALKHWERELTNDFYSDQLHHYAEGVVAGYRSALGYLRRDRSLLS